VERVARSYVQAGSQIILSNTFGANRIVLGAHSAADRAAEINRAGAELSLRAAGEGAQVFASVGPSGKMMSMGDVTESDLRTAFEEQTSALRSAGIEAVVLETFTDLEEVTLALRAAKQNGLFTVACMVFDSGRDKDRTAMGTTIEQAVQRLTAEGADAVGANCGRGIEAYLEICQRLKASTPLPLWLKPNAGLPQYVDGQVRYAIGPDEFAAGAQTLVAAGASFVGGCCGSSPAFIAAIARALRAG
jgi:methionine synthase I (cobalamin-dependent)